MSPPEPPPRPAEVSPAPSGSRHTRWLRLAAIGLAVVGLAVIGLRGRFPDPREFVAALAGAGYGWVALAALLQVVSVAAFAFQQRRLLDDLGVRLRRRHLMAITLARSALSITLPAGAAVSTGYAIRQYRHAGVTRKIGAASQIVSGLASIGGLTLLYIVGGAGIVAQNPGAFLSWRPLAVVAALAAVTAGAVAIGRRHAARPDRKPPGDPDQERAADRRVPYGRVGHLAARLLSSARDAWRAGATLRARDWAAALAYAAVNWLTDLLCLAAVTKALGLPVGLATLAGIYLGVQIVRQVPLTPGGVGVIETALMAGFTAAGATAIGAAAAVLIYRLISCWLIIPVGGIAAVALRRGRSSSSGRALQPL